MGISDASAGDLPAISESIYETELDAAEPFPAGRGGSISAEQAAADVAAALAEGWTLGRVGKYEVLFAPGATDASGDDGNGRQNFIG